MPDSTIKINERQQTNEYMKLYIARHFAICTGMKLLVVQTNPVFGDKKSNLESIDELIGDQKADLIILPELCTTGYQFMNRKQLADLSETTNGATCRYFGELASRTNSHVVAGFAEKDDDRLFNSALMAGPGEIKGIYRKVHLFDKEKLLFDKGDLGFSVFSAGEIPIGMMVCFDWIFPESARSLALAGAQIIAHPANLVLPHCQNAIITRALENHVFIATANRIGVEGNGPEKLVFTGRSRVVSPSGRVLADGPSGTQAVMAVEINPGEAADKHITSRNDLFDDRRPSQYKL